MGAQDHPVAYVDETWIQRPGHPGVYLLAAVLAERTDIDALATAARIAAGNQEYHSTHLYQRGHVGVIEDMLDVVQDHAAWTVIIAHAPITDGNEIARQSSLTRLLTELDKQKVADVTLDLRGSPDQWQQARDKGMTMPEPNHRDLRTYRHLVRGGDISPRMRLTHVNDRHEPGLWLADAAAWATRRALSTDEPQWFRRIADAATVLDATTGAHLRINDNRAAPPAGDRDPHEPAHRNLTAPAEPMVLPRPDYADPASTRHTVVTQHMASLLDQAQAAREPGVVVPAAIAAQLLDSVAALTHDVTRLRQVIDQHGHNTPATAAPDQPALSTPTESPNVTDAATTDRDVDMA